MSHFLTSTNNSRGNEVSASSTKKSGQTTHARGWNAGVKVYARFNEKTGQDEFHIYHTGGSTGATNDKHIGTVIGDIYQPVLKEN